MAAGAASSIVAMSCFVHGIPTEMKNTAPIYHQVAALQNQISAYKEMILYLDGDFQSLMKSICHEPTFKKKVEWVKDKTSDAKSVPMIFVTCAILGGIMSSGSMLMSLLKIVPEFASVNDLIATDKILATLLNCFLYHNPQFANKPSDEIINDMVDEAVKLEKEFFDNVLSGSNQQLTKVQVGTDHRHIEEAQDQILEELGLKEIKNRSHQLSFEKIRNSSEKKVRTKKQLKNFFSDLDKEKSGLVRCDCDPDLFMKDVMSDLQALG